MIALELGPNFWKKRDIVDRWSRVGRVVTTRQVPRLSLLSYVHGGPREQNQFIQSFYDGLRDYGFVVLVDHTLAQEQIDGAYQLTTQFFDLPEDVKNRYSAAGQRGTEGYTAFGREHARDSDAPDLKEFWHVVERFPRIIPILLIILPIFGPARFQIFNR